MYLKLIWLYLLVFPALAMGSTWEQAQRDKRAQIDLYWYTSIPFIYENARGELGGIEHDLVVIFGEYLRQKHQIDLTLTWHEAPNFHTILDRIKDAQKPNQMGLSAFSITSERQGYLRFTNSYLSDITVLVSSQGTPIARTYEEINEMMREMVAVTIKGTTYETLLLNLKEQLKVDFEIQYIESDQNVLDNIALKPDRFGFIDLPIYLMLVRNGGDLTRQNLFTVKGTGYGVIMPQSSDWDIPFNAFLADTTYREQIAGIMASHLGPELYEFMDNVYGGGELGTSILTKEKELQLALIKNANLMLEEGRTLQRILFLGIAVTTIFLIVTGVLFYNNQRKTRLLMSQKEQIEAQQDDIRRKNEQLVNRNVQLISLNEEKNNLVKIFAHDLRSPLGQIIGLSDFLGSNTEKMSGEDREILTQISQGARRINQMITKILDVDSLEGNQSMVLLEQIDLRQITQDIANRYRPLAAKKDIELQVVEPEEPHVIETDHMLLFLVLENLVSNAVKFSGPRTRVTLQAEHKPGEVLFKVADEGPGFTEEDRMMLFNRFQKLSAQPTGGELSIGLGLSIVKKYVTDLGGKVWLDPQHDRGSLFVVSLPV